MGIHHEGLDTAVRAAMEAELDRDIEADSLYESPRIADQESYRKLLREAIRAHNDDWLAAQLRSQNLLRTHEQRRRPNGGISEVAVPLTAAETLAEGEFNRFFARGLCLVVIASGGTHVVACRGKQVANPRPQSEQALGREFLAEELLADLRDSQGVEPALGLPPGPNSGLTVKKKM